jgi:large subunit ribosomal protein L4
MIELNVYNKAGKKVDSLTIDEAQLGGEVRPALLKQAYVRFHAHQRQGSARTKSKGMVAGSTKKLYRQKGTGNARMGQKRTNIRKGGGVAFAKTRTRDAFRQAMPRKMRQLANRNALLAKLVDDEVKVIDSIAFKEPKTNAMRAILDALGVDRTCLVALDAENRNGMLSARNLEDVSVLRVDQLNVFDLLNHRYLVVDKAALLAFIDGGKAKTGAKSKEAA